MLHEMLCLKPHRSQDLFFPFSLPSLGHDRPHSTQHKIFFMMHKCSLSHPKLAMAGVSRGGPKEDENENHGTIFFITNLCKTEKFASGFIKCRNFYVFLINAICVLRQMRGHICCYFNENSFLRNESET